MFTGIVENIGKVISLENKGSNFHFQIEAPFTEAIYIDQSIAHNGVCLTVEKIIFDGPNKKVYQVCAIQETLLKTNLSFSKIGDSLNLERCLKLGQRLDGHFVQGHVDDVGLLSECKENEGSWELRITYSDLHKNLIVPKGSICVNGVSLTVIEAGLDYFTVAIIPYTWQHTNFAHLKISDPVNLEFDILGKYIQRTFQNQNQ